MVATVSSCVLRKTINVDAFKDKRSTITTKLNHATSERIWQELGYYARPGYVNMLRRACKISKSVAILLTSYGCIELYGNDERVDHDVVSDEIINQVAEYIISNTP